MQIIDKQTILKELQSEEEDTLFIDPLLEESQVGEVSIDLRLGSV